MDYQQIIERLKLIRMRNHLSAKDLGTGKEQKITITAGSNLSDEEIEKQ